MLYLGHFSFDAPDTDHGDDSDDDDDEGDDDRDGRDEAHMPTPGADQVELEPFLVIH